MDARTAARLLGGVARGNRVSCPGPGHSKKDQSLTVIFTPEGFIVHTFSTNDNWQECKDYVRTTLGVANDWKPDPAKFKPARDRDSSFEWAMEIWANAKSPMGTVVEKYLASRAIPLTPDITCVRYHPRLKMNEGEYTAAMVCLYQDIKTNEPRGVQRTFLRPDATKIDRKMLGPATAAAIKIDPDETVTSSLIVGEGFESCMSGRRLGHTPTWALMSSNAIAAFPVLDGIETLTMLGERDAGRQNEIACKQAARRWIAANREVLVQFPSTGKDMNDAIRTVGNG